MPPNALSRLIPLALLGAALLNTACSDHKAQTEQHPVIHLPVDMRGYRDPQTGKFTTPPPGTPTTRPPASIETTPQGSVVAPNASRAPQPVPAPGGGYMIQIVPDGRTNSTAPGPQP